MSEAVAFLAGVGTCGAFVALLAALEEHRSRRRHAERLRRRREDEHG